MTVPAQGAWATAKIRQVVVNAMTVNSRQYGHGLTYEEVELEAKARHVTLTTYQNRVRDNYAQGFFGRHVVHGKVHYFSLAAEVDHSRCGDSDEDVFRLRKSEKGVKEET